MDQAEIIKEVFEPNRIAKILAELWGREHGCEVTVTLVPKNKTTSSTQEPGG